MLPNRKKFGKLVKSNISMYDPSKIIFQSMNYLSVKKRLLGKGLSFSSPLKYLDYGDYLVNFELLYRKLRRVTRGGGGRGEIGKSALIWEENVLIVAIYG